MATNSPIFPLASRPTWYVAGCRPTTRRALRLSWPTIITIWSRSFVHAGLDEVAASTEAVRRLGDSRTLVKKTVREYQRRFWCGRWPLLTFLLGPIVFAVLSFVAIVLLAYCIFIAVGAAGNSVRSNAGWNSFTKGKCGRDRGAGALFIGRAGGVPVDTRTTCPEGGPRFRMALAEHGHPDPRRSCIWCGFASETSDEFAGRPGNHDGWPADD